MGSLTRSHTRIDSLNRNSSARFGPHSEREVIAIKVDHIEAAHSIVVILGWLNHVGTACDQLGVHLIDIAHEHTDAPVAGEAFGLTRRKQVDGHFVAAQTCIECWLSLIHI